jgi:hypothetical protein
MLPNIRSGIDFIRMTLLNLSSSSRLQKLMIFITSEFENLFANTWVIFTLGKKGGIFFLSKIFISEEKKDTNYVDIIQ